MDPNELQDKLERKYLQILIGYLRSESIDQATTNESAQAFLALEPIANMEDAKSKMDFFVNKFPKFLHLVGYLSSLESEEKTKDVVDEMQKHLRSDNIDAALSVVSKIT